MCYCKRDFDIWKLLYEACRSCMTDAQFGFVVKRELCRGISYGNAEFVSYIAEHEWESATSVSFIIKILKGFLVEHASSSLRDSVKFDIWTAEQFDIHRSELYDAIAEAISGAKQEGKTDVVEYLESLETPSYQLRSTRRQ